MLEKLDKQLVSDPDSTNLHFLYAGKAQRKRLCLLSVNLVVIYCMFQNLLAHVFDRLDVLS